MDLPPARRTDLLLWLLRLRRRYRVTGASMLPELKAGDEVLVNRRAYRHQPPRVGDIVLLYHPHQPGLKMIKRVVAVTADGRCRVQGDNPAESSDSRHFGSVLFEDILGRVTSRFG